MKFLLDPSFKYIRSEDTDVRKTFARIRKEMATSAQKCPSAPVEETKPGRKGSSAPAGGSSIVITIDSSLERTKR